jgi:hypothetical protein
MSVIALLAGCESGGNFVKAKNPQVAANPDKISVMLAESANRASRSLEKLAAIEQTRTPEASVAPVANAPRELQRGVTINWVGPAEKIAQKMANQAGYQFRVLGEKPPAPVVVSLDKDNARVIDVLRDIGLQLGTRGDVKVDAQARLVELQYAARSQNNTGAGTIEGGAAMAPTSRAPGQSGQKPQAQNQNGAGRK